VVVGFERGLVVGCMLVRMSDRVCPEDSYAKTL